MHASLYLTDQITTLGWSAAQFNFALVMLSYVFWIATYVMVIYTGFRHKVVGIPLTAICLNITWELLFGVVVPASPTLGHLALGAVGTWGVRIELLFDGVVLFFLLRYGRSRIPYREIRDHFYLAVGIGLILAYCGQHSFVAYHQDKHGLESAYGINLIMSLLFVFMYFQRTDRGGISHFVAWTKMLGTGVVSLCHVAFMKPWNPNSPIAAPENSYFYPEFMLFLFLSVFLLDCVYIWLTSPHRHANRQPVPDRLTDPDRGSIQHA